MKRMLAVAVFAVLAVPLGSLPALAQDCTLTCTDPGLPPQPEAPRSYTDFIVLAYQGVGRSPNCLELQDEYNRLVSAAYNGTINAEARRFVATLFETQASFDVQDLDTYTQTPQYEARNSQYYTDRTHLEAFVTDLYRAFLQREPDAGGLCFWANDACPTHRKHTILAFEESIEFGDLVDHLYDGGPPPDCGGDGGGGGGDCGGGRIGQVC